LQAYRLAAGLKIKRLEQLSGVSASKISSYESGRSEGVRWVTALRLLQVLGVRLVLPDHTQTNGRPVQDYPLQGSPHRAQVLCQR
jgi:transcriptional regulator with XRE-family HTH domain